MTDVVNVSETLNERWELKHPERDIALSVDAPFDVHSALITAGVIDDPYWRDRELELDWIHESEWSLSNSIEVAEDQLPGYWTLSFECIDCCTTVYVNEHVAGETASQFVRYDLEVSKLLVAGTNHIRIVFHSNSKMAANAAAQFPFELPYLDWNCRVGHTNHIRKAACHAGWDWNIALMPLGLYGDVCLKRSYPARMDELKFVQHHEANQVRLCISVHAHGFDVANVDLLVAVCGQEQRQSVRILPGENQFTVELHIDNPELWWPAGYGPQTLHTLIVRLGAEQMRRDIGLRQIDLLTTPDETGERFAIAVNGQEIFMRGANWIPADALPSRCTEELVENLLLSARGAHMNMLRIWGGGQYEPDWFYDLCDRHGILIWQDFMFACNHYPAADRQWLNLVRREATQQVRRLSSHACIALWCGDNELVGALSWFDVSKANRDRYLANYVMLNHALEEVVENEAIDVPFWPSSPSSGRLNFGDAWHDDRSGDMHFWDVWHSSKDFEHYRSVRPRFCSEFGFQSFPSMIAIERFTEPEDRNVSSSVMDIHQRNVGGNSRIVETLSRYFRFPDGFERMVFLSQVAQGMAMQTAIEFWRSQKPRCMGTLYWQLNDTWPVASWASLEHGGGWKVCHSMARRFYAPVLCTAQPDTLTGDVVVWAIADVPGGVSVTVALSIEEFEGNRTSLAEHSIAIPEDRAVEVMRLPKGAIPEQAFLLMRWRDVDGRPVGENTYFPRRFKSCRLSDANVTAHWREADEGQELVLETDAPAFFVTVGLGENIVYSDNAFILLPKQPKVIRPLHTTKDYNTLPPPTDQMPCIQHLCGESYAEESSKGEVASR